MAWSLTLWCPRLVHPHTNHRAGTSFTCRAEWRGGRGEEIREGLVGVYMPCAHHQTYLPRQRLVTFTLDAAGRDEPQNPWADISRDHEVAILGGFPKACRRLIVKASLSSPNETCRQFSMVVGVEDSTWTRIGQRLPWRSRQREEAQLNRTKLRQPGEALAH